MKRLFLVLMSVILVACTFASCSSSAKEVAVGQICYYGKVFTIGENAEQFSKLVKDDALITITKVNGTLDSSQEYNLDTVLLPNETADVNIGYYAENSEPKALIVFTVYNDTGANTAIRDLAVNDIFVSAASFSNDENKNSLTEDVYIFGGIDCTKREDYSGVESAINGINPDSLTTDDANGLHTYVFTSGEYSYSVIYNESQDGIFNITINLYNN